MSNEERKQAILDLWHDVATDRSLQVGLRLKASEYEAKALGLIGDEPGIALQEPEDEATNQLKKLTVEQVEAIAGATNEKIINAQEAQTVEPKK